MPDTRCGTSAGYKVHWRKREQACEGCLAAKRLVSKTWKQTHPEYDAKAYYDKYYALNKNAILETHKEYYNKNIESALANKRRYHKENPEVAQRASNRRRATLNNVISEDYTQQQVLEIYGDDCHICNEPIDLNAQRGVGMVGWAKALHIDHLIPISLGGNDTLENVRPAHGFCNISKGNKIITTTKEGN